MSKETDELTTEGGEKKEIGDKKEKDQSVIITTRHYFLAKEGSPAGKKYNQIAYKEMNDFCNQTLQSINTEKKTIVKHCEQLLKNYFSNIDGLSIESTEKGLHLTKTKDAKNIQERNIKCEMYGTLVKAKSRNMFDIYEDDNSFYFNVDLHGSLEDSIKISKEGERTLLIQGEILKPYPNNARVILNERFYGNWTISEEIPNYVDMTTAEATVDEKTNILTVKYKKIDPTRVTIAIKKTKKN